MKREVVALASVMRHRGVGKGDHKASPARHADGGMHAAAADAGLRSASASAVQYRCVFGGFASHEPRRARVDDAAVPKLDRHALPVACSPVAKKVAAAYKLQQASDTGRSRCRSYKPDACIHPCSASNCSRRDEGQLRYRYNDRRGRPRAVPPAPMVD
ncbi:hypothetical protein ACVOMV_09765 [Mesorhizobium atlanticum]